jgi:hypothetical protein
MAKKKTVQRSATRPAKSAARKTAKPKAKVQRSAAGKKPVKRATTKRTAPVSAAAGKSSAAPAEAADAALGRVLGSQDEKLYLLFKEDFHARQIFEFLRAETVRDLEQFSPQEIVKLLSQPIHATVRRIRQKLAERNRHLAGDESFVIEYKERTRAS